MKKIIYSVLFIGVLLSSSAYAAINEVKYKSINGRNFTVDVDGAQRVGVIPEGMEDKPDEAIQAFVNGIVLEASVKAVKPVSFAVDRVLYKKPVE